MTPTQHKLLIFIVAYLKEHSYAPSYREMAKAMGINSQGAMWKQVRALERDGFIQLGEKMRARSLTVIDRRVKRL